MQESFSRNLPDKRKDCLLNILRRHVSDLASPEQNQSSEGQDNETGPAAAGNLDMNALH